MLEVQVYMLIDDERAGTYRGYPIVGREVVEGSQDIRGRPLRGGYVWLLVDDTQRGWRTRVGHYRGSRPVQEVPGAS